MVENNLETCHLVFFSLGSNIGNRKRLIREALDLLEERVGQIRCESSMIETVPWGFSSPNQFINACVCCETKLNPRQILAVTQRIEREMGRVVKSQDGEYHDRIIDIDILLYDDLTIDEPGLKIPHPHMKERDFVMNPLQEILLDDEK